MLSIFLLTGRAIIIRSKEKHRVEAESWAEAEIKKVGHATCLKREENSLNFNGSRH